MAFELEKAYIDLYFGSGNFMVILNSIGNRIDQTRLSAYSSSQWFKSKRNNQSNLQKKIEALSKRVLSKAHAVYAFFQSEVVYFKRYLARSKHFAQIKKIVTIALSFFSSNRKPLTEMEKLFQGIKRVDPNFECKKQRFFGNQSVKEVDSLLPKDSENKQADPRAWKCLHALFGTHALADVTLLNDFSTYAAACFRKKKEPELAAIFEDTKFSDAIKHYQDVNQAIRDRAAQTRKVQNQWLSEQAAGMAKKVKLLAKSDSWTFFSKTERKGTSALGIVGPFLKGKLPGSFYKLLQNDPSHLFEQKLKTLIENSSELDQLLFNNQQDELGKILSDYFASIEEKVRRVLPASWYKHLCHSLRKDLEEVFTQSHFLKGDTHALKKVWDQVWEKGYKESIESLVLGAVQKGSEIVRMQIRELVDEIGNCLPSTATQIIEGLGGSKKSKDSFFIEIFKQRNENYTLRLLSPNVGENVCPKAEIEQQVGYVSPLVFSNIPPKKLTEDFFNWLLVCQAWPKWVDGCYFSLDDVYQGLLLHLEQAPDKPKNLIPEDWVFHKTVLDYVEIDAYSRHNKKGKAFQKLVHYELFLQMLIDAWPAIKKFAFAGNKDPFLVEKLEKLIEYLAREGRRYYGSEENSEELKRLCATLSELQNLLRSLKQPDNRAFSSTLFPPAVQEHLRNFFSQTHFNEMYLEVVREAVITVLGDEVKQDLDVILDELLPLLEPQESQVEKKMTWQDIFPIDQIKQQIADFKSMRFSLLHGLQLGFKLYRVASYIIAKYAMIRLIESYLIYFFPSLGLGTIAVRLIAYVLVTYGPFIAKKILPKEVLKTLDAFISICPEMIHYLFRRVQLLALRQGVRYLLDKHQIGSIHAMLKQGGQVFLRSGELSYKVTPIKTIDKPWLQIKESQEKQQKKEKNPKEGAISDFNSAPRATSCSIVNGKQLLACLSQWLKEFEVIHSEIILEEWHKKLAILAGYLNQQVRNLPLPHTQKGKDLFDSLLFEERQLLLEKMYAFLCKVNEYAFRRSSVYESVERAVTAYVLYAWIDYLARQCHDDETTKIPNKRANGCRLMTFIQHPCFKVTNPTTYKQLTHLVRYFGFDLRRWYSDKELSNAQKKCLFFFQEEESSLWSNIDLGGFHLYFSKEADYCHQLLKNKQIQEKLEVYCGKRCSEMSTVEQAQIVFRDPSIKQARKKIKKDTLNDKERKARLELLNRVWEKSTHRFDPRKGLLPRNVHLARAGYALALSSLTLNRRHGGNLNKNFHDHPFVEGLQFTVHNKELEDKNFPWLTRALNTFHQKTYNIFNSFSVTCNLSVPLKRVVSREIGYSGRGEAYGIGCSKSRQKIFQEGWESTFRSPKQRSQSEIMTLGPSIDYNGKILSKEEQRILEMVFSDRKDQIVRILGFFQELPSRIAHLELQPLFDLFLTNSYALRAQLAAEKEMIVTIGNCFTSFVTYFLKNEDFPTFLYLTKVGKDVLMHCRDFDAEADLYFPNFRELIREKVLPFYRKIAPNNRKTIPHGALKNMDKLIMTYFYLVSSYHCEFDLSEEEAEECMLAVACLVYSQIFYPRNCEEDIVLKSNAVCWKWGPSVEQRIKERHSFRKKVIKRLFLDMNIDLVELQGRKHFFWEGAFPRYFVRDSNLSIDLEKTATQGEKKEQFQKKVVDFLKEQGILVTGNGVLIDCHELYFQREKIKVRKVQSTLNQEDYQVYRKFSGKWFRLLAKNESQQCLALSKIEQGQFFIETLPVRTNRPTILGVKNDTIQVKISTLKKEKRLDAKTKYEITKVKVLYDNRYEEVIDSARVQHGLHLLSWFCPFSRIHLFGSSASGQLELTRIYFSDFKLSFELKKNRQNQLCAFSREKDSKGFYLAPKQQNKKLFLYPHALLLTNNRKEKKVYLRADSLPRLMTSFFLQKIGIETSPIIEEALTTAVSCFEEQKQEEKMYIFTLDKKGNLRSEDPEAIAYMVLFHFVKGKESDSYRYACELIDLGRKEPLSNKVLCQLDLMLLPLFLSSTLIAQEIVLRLCAMREANFLIHNIKQDSADFSTDLLCWITLQLKYTQYLQGLERGNHGFSTTSDLFSEYDELFLLKAIVRYNQSLLATQENTFFTEENYSRLVSALGGLTGVGAHLLMTPRILNRYDVLSKKHGKEAKWKQTIKALLLNTVFQETSTQNDCLPANQKNSSGWISYLALGCKKASEQPLVQYKYGNFTPPYLASEFSKKTAIAPFTVPIDFFHLRPKKIYRWFLSYYFLAQKQPLLTWSQKEKDLFYKRSKKFCKNILLVPICRYQHIGLMIQLLQVVAKRDNIQGFPSAIKLQELLNRSRKLKVCRKKIARLRVKELDCDDEAISKQIIQKMIQLQKQQESYFVEVCSGSKRSPEFVFTSEFNRLISRALTVFVQDSMLGKIKQLTLSRPQGILGSMAKIAKKVLEYSFWSMTGLNSWWRLARFSARSLPIIAKVIQGKKVKKLRQKDLSMYQKPLPRMLAKQAQKRDDQITKTLKSILEEYFTVFVTSCVLNQRVADYPGGECDKLNKSLRDYYDQDPPKQIYYRLRKDKTPRELYKKLLRLKKLVDQQLQKERQEIEAYMNFPFEKKSNVEVLKNMLCVRKKSSHFLTLEALEIAVIREELERLFQNSTMKQEHVNRVKGKLLLYKILRSRFLILFSLLEKIGKDIAITGGVNQAISASLQKIGQELDHTRVYQFDTNDSARLIWANLMFEDKTGARLRKVQYEQTKKMLRTLQLWVVVQIIMGGGKTYYVMPVICYVGANKTQIMINIVPASLAPVNTAALAKQGRVIFAQPAYRLPFDRSTCWTESRLEAVFNQLRRALYCGYQHTMIDVEVQSIENSFLETVLGFGEEFDQHGQKIDIKKVIGYYKKILLLFRKKACGNMDEFHNLCQPGQELNYPVGTPNTLPAEDIENTLDIMASWIKTPFLNEIIKSKSPAPITEKTFQEKILPQLIDQTFSFKLFQNLCLTSHDKDALIEYISGYAQQMPSLMSTLDPKQKRNIALVKGVLELLKMTLAQIVNVHFGFSNRKGNGEYARPSEGNNSPLEDAKIRNPFECLVKTVILFLYHRLTFEQLDRYVTFCRQKALLQAEKFSIDKRKTKIARIFPTIDFQGHPIDLFDLNETNKKAYYSELNQYNHIIFNYIEKYVALKIRYYSINISSNAQNFMSMFRRSYGCTGTPYNEGCYPMQTKVLWGKGVLGKSLDCMQRKASQPDSVRILEAEAPIDCLREIIQNYFGRDRSTVALIDRDPMLNGVDPIKVAALFLSYIEQYRPDIEGIAFYTLDKKLVIWKKKTKKPVPLIESELDSEKIFAYFPELQTFGADIRLKKGGKGLVTIGVSITLTKLCQAVWRMRRLDEHGQKGQKMKMGKSCNLS